MTGALQPCRGPEVAVSCNNHRWTVSYLPLSGKQKRILILQAAVFLLKEGEARLQTCCVQDVSHASLHRENRLADLVGQGGEERPAAMLWVPL